MEIERVNESTVKFFITYNDIENRGFDRDEIWYNRERGEELFFEMMNEASDREEFELDGPLWVQVHALEKGLEVIVTRGEMNEGNVKLEIPVDKEKYDDPVDDNIVDMLDHQFNQKDKKKRSSKPEKMSIVLSFDDFEDIISLSHRFEESVQNQLYHFEGVYFLYVTLGAEYTEEEQDNIISRMLEYGDESDTTIYRIAEYGTEIIANDALAVIQENFAPMT
ncbi:adaptor protein MecA [Texcoconibacillus texcoconensis]|uniref:Adapter protein MecA n=1 Tax=Texcoconibacillus texcoconensis TaxID=1095777 RepID=A0A840QU55_9BACI|nr:adaptor protein MecA [Texcoconibacillus texcoconensis]MBB5174843.1 adapter protein MecA 1/2 [Texcoconibacillus texcoconensis]